MTSAIPVEEVSMPDLAEPAQQTASEMVTSQTISADEVALYDRQIRLWGMEAQQRMRTANILIIGMRALANEVAKNLVLAGIGSLTILDSEDVVEDDLGAQFFISEEDVGINRARAAAPEIQKLNPRVPVHIDTDKVQDKPTDYFKQFDIVIATDLDIDSMLFINEATRKCGVRFYAAATYGLYGFIFADLLVHQFVVKRIKSNVRTQCGRETRTRSVIATTETKEGETIWEFVEKEETFCSLADTIGSKVDKKWRPRRRKNIGSILPGIMALWKFQQTFGHLPEGSKEDFKEFTKTMTEVAAELEMPPEMVKSEFIRPFVENATAELSPVAAVLGGLLAQDAINVLAKLQQPIQNLLLFDGDISSAPIVVLAPQDED